MYTFVYLFTVCFLTYNTSSMKAESLIPPVSPVSGRMIGT